MARFRLLISIRNPFSASIFLIRIRSKVPFLFASKEPLKITKISASPLTRTRIFALLVHPPRRLKLFLQNITKRPGNRQP